MRILIKNADVIETMAGERLKSSDIFVNDNIIEDIGKNLDRAADEIINASGMVILPGFINTHHHFYQTFTRNLPKAQNAGLFDWLRYHYGVWAKMTQEDIYYSALTAISELMLTGVTTTTDHLYLYNDSSNNGWIEYEIKAAKELGMRFYPTRGSMSLSEKDGGLPPDIVVQSEEMIMRHTEDIVNKYHDKKRFSMLRIALAPCSPFSVSRELLKQVSDYAEKKGLLLHTHLAETKDEEEFCVEKFGKRPYWYLKDNGWISDRVFNAHCIYLNDEEIYDMAKNGAGVAHCPCSNMRLGSGFAKIPQMLSLNMKVSIAVDGSASNDTSDYLGEMRQALLLSRVKWGAESIKTMDVFKMATVNGARIFKMENDIGTIEKGKAADIVVWKQDDISYIGSQSDPIASLIFSGRHHRAEYVIINGNITVRKGELTGLDQRELRENALKQCNDFYGRSGIIE